VSYVEECLNLQQPFDGWREPKTREEMQAWLSRYRRGEDGLGPVRYVKEVKRADPDPWQIELLTAYGNLIRRISVKSGHNVGKSCAAAWCIDHHQSVEIVARAAVTAPTEKQMFNVLYPEVVKWLQRGPEWLQAQFTITSDRIAYTQKLKDWYVSFATARAETPEALAGVHLAEGSVLLVPDEASGIHEKVYESASGSMAGHEATTILFGNPVRTSGLFFDSHTRLKWNPLSGPIQPGQWYCITVNAETSPRVAKDFIADMARRYGRDSNQYRVRVLGEFPSTDADTVIPYEHILRAQERDITVEESVPTIWGVDVARFGEDATALVKRRGKLVPEVPKLWRQKDTMQVASLVHEEWKATPGHLRPKVICVDSIGIGSGVVDRLKQLGLPVRGINVSEMASFSDQYANLRAELWFQTKAWFATMDCKIPPDDLNPGGIALGAELALPRFRFLPSGKLQIESKVEIKKRGFDSPNCADALMMTMGEDAATYIHGTLNSNEPIKRGLKFLTGV